MRRRSFDRRLRDIAFESVVHALLERDDDDKSDDDAKAKAAKTEKVKAAKAAKAAKAKDRDDDVEVDDDRGGPCVADAARRADPAPGTGTLNVMMFVDKLNAIRSGASLSSDDVVTRLTGYLEDMSPTQQLAYYAFLEGTAEVVAAGVDGDDARLPSDPDINVNMSHEGGEGGEREGGKSVQRPAQSGAPRVVKRDAEEYAHDTGLGSPRGVAVKQDAYDDEPVMISRR